MKKIISWIICAALLLPLFGLAAQARGAEQTSFVVLGDSIAAGTMNIKSQTYARIIAREKNYKLSNFGEDGDGTADLLRKITTNKAMRRAVSCADIIAISVGGNDLRYAEEGLTNLMVSGLLGDYGPMAPTVRTYAENFAKIIDEIYALNPDVRLIVQTLYNPAFPLPALHEAYAAGVGAINDTIYAYLEANEGAYVIADVFSAFEQRSGLVLFDMMHPSPAGHALISEVLLDVIDGTQTPLPPAGIWDYLVDVGEPLFAPLDWVLVEAARLLHRLLGPVWTLIKF